MNFIEAIAALDGFTIGFSWRSFRFYRYQEWPRSFLMPFAPAFTGLNSRLCFQSHRFLWPIAPRPGLLPRFFTPPTLTMTLPSSLLVIPLLAIAYLVVVYGALVLAKRVGSSSRSQG